MKQKQRTSSCKDNEMSQQDTPTVDVSSQRVVGPVKFRFQKRGVSTFTLSEAVTITVTLGKLEIRSTENEFPPFSLKTTDFVKPPKALAHRIASWFILDCVQQAEYTYICIQVDAARMVEVVDTLMFAWSSNKTTDSDSSVLIDDDDGQIIEPIDKPPVLNPESGSSGSKMLGQKETTIGGSPSVRVIESVHVRYLKKGTRSFIFSRLTSITATPGKITFTAKDKKFSPFTLKTYEIVKAPEAPKGDVNYLSWLVLDCIQYPTVKFLCINIQAEPDRMSELVETLMFAWSSNKINDSNSSDIFGDSDPFIAPVHKPPALLQEPGSGSGRELIQQATSIGGSSSLRVIESVRFRFLEKGASTTSSSRPVKVTVTLGKITITSLENKFLPIVLKTSDVGNKPKEPKGKINTWLTLDCVQHRQAKYTFISFQVDRSTMADIIDILLFAWDGNNKNNDANSSDVFDDSDLFTVPVHKPPALLQEPGSGSGRELIQQATPIGGSPSVRVIESVQFRFLKKGTLNPTTPRPATVTVTLGKITITSHDDKFFPIVLKTSDVANKPKEPRGKTTTWFSLDCVQHVQAKYIYVSFQVDRSMMADIIDLLLFAWEGNNKNNDPNTSGVFGNPDLYMIPVHKPPALLQEPGSGSCGELIQQATSIGGSPSVRVIDSVQFRFLKKGSSMPSTLLPATVTVTPGKLAFLSVDDKFESFTLKTTDFIKPPKAPMDKRSSWLALDCAQHVRAKYIYVNIKVDTTRMADVVDILNLAWSKYATSDPNSSALFGDIDIQPVHNTPLWSGSGKLIQQATSIGGSPSVRVIDSVQIRYLKKASKEPTKPRPATITVTPGNISVVAHDNKFEPFTLKTWEFVNPPKVPMGKTTSWLGLDFIDNIYSKFRYISIQIEPDRMSELVEALMFAWSSNKNNDPPFRNVFNATKQNKITAPPPLISQMQGLFEDYGLDGLGQCKQGQSNQKSIYSVILRYVMKDSIKTPKRACTSITTITVTPGKLEFRSTENKFPTFTLKTSDFVGPPQAPSLKTAFGPQEVVLDCIQHDRVKYQYLAIQIHEARMAKVIDTLMFAWINDGSGSSDASDDTMEGLGCPVSSHPSLATPAQKTTTLRDILEDFCIVDEEVKPAPVHKKMQPSMEMAGLFDDYDIDEVKPKTIDNKMGLNKLLQEPVVKETQKKTVNRFPYTSKAIKSTKNYRPVDSQMQMGLGEGISGRSFYESNATCPPPSTTTRPVANALRRSSTKDSLDASLRQSGRTVVTPGIRDVQPLNEYNDDGDDWDPKVFHTPLKILTSINSECRPPVAKKAKLSDGMEAVKEYKEIEKEFILLAEKVFRLEKKGREDVVNSMKKIVENALKTEE